MAFNPPGGLRFFNICVGLHLFFRTVFFFFSTKLGMKRPFKKGQVTWLTVKYIQLIIPFLMEALFIRLYPVGEDLQKNGS